jgi:hypothetical protein
MKTRTKPRSSRRPALLALALLAAGGIVGWQLWRATPPAPVARASSVAPRAETVAPATPQFGPTDANAMGDGPPGFGQMPDTAQMQEFMQAQMTNMVDTGYADLFDELNLPPEQAEKMRALLVKRMSVFGDVMNTAMQQGLNPFTDAQQLQQMTTAAQAQVDTGIQAMLDPASYQTYQDYNTQLVQTFGPPGGLAGGPPGGGGGGGFGGGGP